MNDAKRKRNWAETSLDFHKRRQVLRKFVATVPILASRKWVSDKYVKNPTCVTQIAPLRIEVSQKHFDDALDHEALRESMASLYTVEDLPFPDYWPFDEKPNYCIDFHGIEMEIMCSMYKENSGYIRVCEYHR